MNVVTRTEVVDVEARLAELENNIENHGSNSWTIAPSRTATCRPNCSPIVVLAGR